MHVAKHHRSVPEIKMESIKEPSAVLSEGCPSTAASSSSGDPSSDVHTYQDDQSENSPQGKSGRSGKQPPGEAGGIDSVVKGYNDRTDCPTVNVEHGNLFFDSGTFTPWALSWSGDKFRETHKFKLYLYFSTQPGTYEITPDDVASKLKGLVSSDHIAQIKAAMDWVNRTTEA